MDDKVTQRVTIEELVAMVSRILDTQTKHFDAKIDSLETLMAQMLVKIDELPERIADKLFDHANLQKQVTALTARVNALEGRK